MENKDNINIIFNKRLFSDDRNYEQLRTTIAAAINMGDLNIMFGPPQQVRISYNVLNEWYYIMKAIKEAELANSSMCIRSFVKQMVEMFPVLFPGDTMEVFLDSKVKMARAISKEKRLWKLGEKRKEVTLKDMWKKGIDKKLGFEKANRIYEIAYKGLLMNLLNLKHEIEKRERTNNALCQSYASSSYDNIYKENELLLRMNQEKERKIQSLTKELEETKKKSKQGLVINGPVNGDLVLNKHVENEVGHVSSGGTGIDINNNKE